MSLLLDALKKAGQDRQDGKAEDRPGDPGALYQTPPAGQAQDDEPARDAVKNLFSAKLPAEGRLRLGILPIALASGLTLAAAGGGYVWYEISANTPVAVAPMHASPPVVARPAPPLAPLPVAPEPMPASEEQEPARPVIHEAIHSAPAESGMGEPRTRIHIESRQQTNSIDPMLSSAYQSYQQGDYATAQQQYVTVLRQDPRNRDALLGMAGLAQLQGQDELAARYYQHVLTLDPRDPVAHAGIAGLIQGDAPGKESRLKLLLAQQPQSAALNFALGNLYAEQQRWPESQQAYFNAYRLQPDSAEYAYNLAVSLDHLGQSKAAAQHYQRALQLDGSGTAGFDHTQVTQRLNALKAP